MVFETLQIERIEPGISVIRVHRPEALNALNTRVLQELKRSLESAAQDPAVRAIILTGSGEKAFIAGADITEMKDKTGSQGTQFSQLGHDVAKLLERMNKPTIAAVNGFALGGGTEMAIACDFIVCSENAVFGQPEVALGVIPGFGATFRLARFVGFPRAKEMVFTGRRVKAPEALALGLVNHVYSIDELMPKAIELAQSITRNSLSAVTRCKELMNEFAESIGLNNKIDAEALAFGRLFGSPDQREGMTAFVEKRKPHFQGLNT